MRFTFEEEKISLYIIKNALQPCIIDEALSHKKRIFALKASIGTFDLVLETGEEGVILASFRTKKAGIDALADIFRTLTAGKPEKRFCTFCTMKKYNIPKFTWTRFKTDENPESEPVSEGFGIPVESPFGVPDPILKKLLGDRLRISESPAWGAVPAPEMSIFDSLESDFPNFHEAVKTIRTFAFASRLRPEIPLRWPPLLLLGPPGLRKTEFVFELCERLCVPFYQVPCSSNSGGSMSLAGSDER